MCRAGSKDGSRRETDSTTHKMNWTKPLGRGGWPLADLKTAAEGLDGAGGTLDAVTEPLAGEEGRCAPCLPPSPDAPRCGLLGRSISLWTHEEGAGVEHIGVSGEASTRPP